MIDCYFFPTPNGRKITIALEELALDYQLIPVNILQRQQFSEEYFRINPNNKIPAIIDHDIDGAPITVFESGAILLYLAEKTGQLLPNDVRGRTEVIQWLMWQMAGLGPMAGQSNHFNKYAREDVPYAIDRYTHELTRLYTVMDKRLEDRLYLCDHYSIADITCYGWVDQAADGGQILADFPSLSEWFTRLSDRAAVQRGMNVGLDLSPPPILSDEQHASLFSLEAQS